MLLTFVDDAHVEVVQNLTRVQRDLANSVEPVVQRDRPWESTLYLNGTWSLRKVGERFLLWYEDWDFDVRKANSGGAAFAETGGNQRFSSVALSHMRILLAESEDGERWFKPPLDGERNVVLGGEFGNVHAFSVVQGPDGRLRALFVHETAETSHLQHSLVRSAWSDDGREWVVDEESPVFGTCGPHLGDVINLSVDSSTGDYLAFTRHPNQFLGPVEQFGSPATASSFFASTRPGDRAYHNKRRIWLSRSADFIKWTEPVEIIVPDLAVDNLDDSFYSLSHFDTGDGNLGFLSILHEVENTIDVWLVHSRDLTTWQRVPSAGPLIQRGRPGTWDSGLVNVCSPPILVGDEVFVFYAGAPHRHDWWWVGEREGLKVPDATLNRGEYALGLTKTPRNRFVGLHAGERIGMLVTRPLDIADCRIIIDAETEPGGYVQVEILTPEGTVVADRNAARADATDYLGPITMTWGEDSNSRLKPGYRIRVLAHRATIYSLELK